MSILSKKKFSSLTTKRQHKHAAALLQKVVEGNAAALFDYREYEKILSLERVCENKKKLLDRIFHHESQAMIPYKKII